MRSPHIRREVSHPDRVIISSTVWHLKKYFLKLKNNILYQAEKQNKKKEQKQTESIEKKKQIINFKFRVRLYADSVQDDEIANFKYLVYIIRNVLKR